jgi:hypothetical protein
MPYRRVVESVGDTGAWALFASPGNWSHLSRKLLSDSAVAYLIFFGSQSSFFFFFLATAPQSLHL